MGISEICGFLKIRDTILGGPMERIFGFLGVYVGVPSSWKLLYRIRSQNVICKQAGNSGGL